MRARSAAVGSRALTLAAAIALVAAAPRGARAQDISCDREGAREVRSLKFEGNRTFTSDELSARVVTTPSSRTRRWFGWFFNSGTARCLPDNGLEPDVTNLRAFYKNNGFYETQVDTVVDSLGVDRVGVTFRIDEGTPLHANAVAITGLDSVPDRAAVLRGLLVKPGERTGRLQLAADVDSITARLRNQGFPRAAVFPAFTTNLSQQRVDVAIDVVTGPRSRIGTIDIQRTSASEGQPAGIDSATVLGLLGFRTGDWFSDRALSDGARNLYNLGAYRHVGIAVDTTQVVSDTLVRVSADVREDYLRQIQLEEGWGTLDCFRIDAQYTDKNFMDRAWRMDLTARTSKLGYGRPTDTPLTRNLCYRRQLDADSIGSSKLNYYTGVTIRQPTLFGGHWVPQYAAYMERRGAYKAYLRTTYVGLDASTTRNIGRLMPFRLGYTLEFGRTQAEAAVLCAVFARCDAEALVDVQRRMQFAVASASLQQNHTDNPVSPRSGYNWAIEFRASNRWLGADTALTFQKITGDFSLYRPITSGVTLAARVRGGYVAQFPPPQERLYAGGALSDRGFRENELGPLVYILDSASFERVKLPGDSTVALIANPQARAARTVPVGGNALVLLNAELRIRDPFFPDLLEYVPFVDAGQLWTRERGTQKINLDRLIVTPGFGLRYHSPVGPIQANVGYNRSKTRAGPAYWAVPIDDPSAVNAPLLCVTPPSAPPVPIPIDSQGRLLQRPTNCPADFVPFESSNFFNRLVLTVSIGTSF